MANQLSAKERRALLSGRRSQNGFLVVALPRPTQGVALFAARYQSPTSAHPLLPGTAATLWPLQVLRREQTYLVPRGGGQASLLGKRVLLVGCGAVGGRLAHDLVQSGVLQTLKDMNRAYLTHIIADSADGPRGDAVLSEQLKADPSNIMLLCDTHHRLIDKIEVAEHPVDLRVAGPSPPLLALF